MAIRSRSPSQRIPLQHVSVTLGMIRASLRRGILPVFVFDGPPETLKRAPSPEIIQQAEDLYVEFSRSGNAYDEVIARRLGQNRALRWYFCVAHIKDLCTALGIPIVHSPSEAEMAAAALCRDGIVGSVVSNDADALLFGSRSIIRTLHLSAGQMECATLTSIQSACELSLRGLRDLAIICGCDFHPGLRGIGPRRGVLEIQRHGTLERVLDAMGVPPVEQEEYLLAREVFDESDLLSFNAHSISLRPPLPSRLMQLLIPVLGAERSEMICQQMVRIWRDYGQRQSILEEWL